MRLEIFKLSINARIRYMRVIRRYIVTNQYDIYVINTIFHVIFNKDKNSLFLSLINIKNENKFGIICENFFILG